MYGRSYIRVCIEFYGLYFQKEKKVLQNSYIYIKMHYKIEFEEEVEICC